MDVIFVSHQWSAYQHPDPHGHQHKCLQRVLERLLIGETSVENNYMQQLTLKNRGFRPPKWWKHKLKNMYIWLDFMCMPQPSSVKDESDSESMISHSEALSTDSKSNIQDSRIKHKCETAKLLSDAVQSLPAYVELSWMMLVLAPTIEHVDRPNEIVHWCSWRNRGWCSWRNRGWYCS